MFGRTCGIRRVLVLGAIGLGSCVGPSTPAQANGHFRRAFGLTPSGYVEYAPTVSIIPTAYFVPTSYFVPTTYAYTTSYVSLIPTAYVVPTVYSTTWGLPSALPTVYAIPTSRVFSTVYETGFAVDCCETQVVCDPCGGLGVGTDLPVVSDQVVPAAAPPSGGGTPSAPQKTTPPGVSSAVQPPTSVESAPANPDAGAAGAGAGAGAPSSSVTEPTTRRKPSPAASPTPPTPAPPAAAPGVDPGMPSPPAAPAAERDLSVAPAAPPAGPVTPIGPDPAPLGARPEAAQPKAANPPGPASPAGGAPGADPAGVKPPVAPGEGPPPVVVPAPAPGENETVERTVQRPVMTAASRVFDAPYRRSARNLHWLEGKVVAGGSGQPEEGVKITMSRKGPSPTELVVISDETGRYGVRLPDGAWTVRVAMPSGRTYAVSELVVDRGQIVDDLGRPIPTLTITR